MIGVLKLAGLLLPLSLMLVGCDNWQSAWDVQGEFAMSLKQLIILIVTVCSVVWTLVMIALISALVRGRRRAEPPTVDAATERRITVTVLIAVAATVVIIAVFTVSSFFTSRALSVAGGEDLTIK